MVRWFTVENSLNKMKIVLFIIMFSSISINANEYSWELFDEYYPYGETKPISWNKLAVLDSNNIFVAGKNWEQNVEIRYTQDGGKTWTSRVLEKGYWFTDSSTGETKYIHPSLIGSISFLDKNKIILQSGSYYWISQGSLDSLKKMKYDFDDYFTYLKMENDSTYFGITSRGYFMKSINDFKSWDTIKKINLSDSINQLISKQNPFNNGMITRDSTIYLRFFIGEEVGELTTLIAKSTDYGDSWEVIRPLVDWDWIVNFHFLDKNVGWYSAERPYTDMSYRHVICKTTDGGNTWIEQLDTLMRNPNDNFGYMRFRDSTNGIAIGDWFKIFKTSDGGNYWKYLDSYYQDYKNDSYPFLYLRAFEYINDNQIIGIVYYDPVILKFTFDKESSILENFTSGTLIYPNPASDYITINLSSINPMLKRGVEGIGAGVEEELVLEIYDVMGMKIQSTPFETQNIVSLQQRIDISNLSQGVYFLKIGDKVEKFVKY